MKITEALRRLGTRQTTIVEGREITVSPMPFRRIAQYDGLPVVHPDGRPCYDLPGDAVLSLRGTLKIGDNLQAAYVYEGPIKRI